MGEAATDVVINEDALRAAHLAVEDVLVGLRDEGLSVMGPANGFVIRPEDLSDFDGLLIMRLGTREGLRIAISAYLAAAQTTGRASDG